MLKLGNGIQINSVHTIQGFSERTSGIYDAFNHLRLERTGVWNQLLSESYLDYCFGDLIYGFTNKREEIYSDENFFLVVNGRISDPNLVYLKESCNVFWGICLISHLFPQICIIDRGRSKCSDFKRNDKRFTATTGIRIWGEQWIIANGACTASYQRGIPQGCWWNHGSA